MQNFFTISNEIKTGLQITISLLTLSDFTHLIPSGTDITARRAAVEKLHESEERFRAAVNAVSYIIWTNNSVGKMSGDHANRGAFTGQSREDYQGWGWSKAVQPENARRTTFLLGSAMNCAHLYPPSLWWATDLASDPTLPTVAHGHSST